MSALYEESSAGLTRQLAEFSAGFVLAQAPTKAVENAKLVMLDCFGVSVLATGNEVWRALNQFLQANGAEGSCRIWGTGITASMRDAAFANGTLAHGLDYDDRNHSSTYTLAAAMAVAEEKNLSGKVLLESFIVGREVRSSLNALFASRAQGIGPGARGWHANGVLGAIAAACSAARGLGLDADTTQVAIGLAAGACGALTRDGGTMAKPFRCGSSASMGITSALLAQSGFSSDAAILEGPYGLFDALGPMPEELLGGLGHELGQRFGLEESIAVKPYASCSATHAPLEAMLRLLEKIPITPEEVERLETNLRPYPCLRRSPSRGYEGRFSVPFCLAIALVHGRLLPEDMNDVNAQDPKVKALVMCSHHDSNAKGVTVTLKDGRRFFEPFAPRTDLKARAEIESKFHRSVINTLADNQARIVVDLVLSMDQLSEAREITLALKGTAPAVSGHR